VLLRALRVATRSRDDACERDAACKGGEGGRGDLCVGAGLVAGLPRSVLMSC